MPSELHALLATASLTADDVELVAVGFDPRVFMEGGVDVYPVFLNNEPDTIVVFQLHSDPGSGNEFVNQPWYDDYERETAELLAGPSEFRTATPQWMKKPVA